MLYRYRLYLEDGTEAGKAHYAVMIRPGETIWTGGERKLKVLDVARLSRAWHAGARATAAVEPEAAAAQRPRSPGRRRESNTPLGAPGPPPRRVGSSGYRRPPFRGRPHITGRARVGVGAWVEGTLTSGPVPVPSAVR
jgi:hypothetical protein